MHEEFKIYVDRLKGGQNEEIDETVLPEALEIEDEKEVAFPASIHVFGEAYLAEDHLVLHLNISTKAMLPCAICNEKFTVPIELSNVYLSTPLSEIPGAAFDYASEAREAIFLQLPVYFECHEGSCPERKQLNNYLKQPSSAPKPSSGSEKEGANFPFADLS